MKRTTRELPRRRVLARLMDAPDLLVIAGWAAVICAAAALRANFIGDGVRHLLPILTGSRPSLGEPRWLLFPAFLFAIVKPLQTAGLVNSLKDAARVFMALDVFVGVAYLMLIRQWLRSRSVSARSRAGSLLLAGMTVPLLRFSSDLVEVLIPATIALAGLVYLASRPPENAGKGLCVAAAAIALATLLYQGTIVAVALVPCATAQGASVRMRTIALFCVTLAVAPLLMLTAMVAAGNNPRTAIHMMLTGEENSLFRDRMASHRLPILERPIAAISLGAARSIIEIPDNRGFRIGVRLMSRRTTFMEGASTIGGCLVALAIVVAGAVAVVRRRDWRIAIAFAGVLILAVVRGYAYLKYYMLMPVVVALVAAVSPPAIVLTSGALAGYFNLTYLAVDIARDRRLARDIAPLYESAGTSACWLTTGWGPQVFGWPGSQCSMSPVLTGAQTDRVDLMIAENNRELVNQLRRCFCESSAVYTDDVTVSSKAAVSDLAKYYKFDGIELNELLWSPQKGTTALDREGIAIFTYARPVQLQICDRLKAASANVSR